MDEPAALPPTRASLGDELRRLGLARGQILLVHSSLRAVGWVVGGPVAVVQALLDVLGPEGTIVVPTHVNQNSDPAEWRHPPVPEAWWQLIRDQMPGFDPQRTPSLHMGILAETVRTWPEARRSAHPSTSFAALGPNADAIVAEHGLDFGLGEGSPLGELYRRDARVLLIGVGYERSTSFHLAEYRLPGRLERREGAAALEDGQQVWRWYRDIEIDEAPFPEIGRAFEAGGDVRVGRLGKAEARLFGVRPAVDFAEAWMRARLRP